MNKENEPQLVTLAHSVAHAAYLASYASVFTAVSFLGDTPLSTGVSLIVGFAMWRKLSNGARGMSAHYGRLYIARHEREMVGKEYNDLANISAGFAARAKLKQGPFLYLHNDPDGEDFAVDGASPPVLIISQAILKHQDAAEVEAGIGHEITHLAARHIEVRRAADILIAMSATEVSWHLGESLFSGRLDHIGTAIVTGAVVAAASVGLKWNHDMFMERQADRGSLVLCHDAKAAISGLEKVSTAIEGHARPSCKSLREAYTLLLLWGERQRPAHMRQFAHKHHIPV